MLIGEKQPEAIAGRAAGSVLLALFLTPWLLLGAGCCLVGLMALGPRRDDIPELWVCLPAGVVLLLVAGLMLYWVLWRWPRLTIARFELDGDAVVTVTLWHGL